MNIQKDLAMKSNVHVDVCLKGKERWRKEVQRILNTENGPKSQTAGKITTKKCHAHTPSGGYSYISLPNWNPELLFKLCMFLVEEKISSLYCAPPDEIANKN